MSQLDSLTNLYKLKPPPSCPVSVTISSSPLHVRKVTTSGITVQEEGLWCHLYVSGIRKDVLCFLFSSSSTWCLGDPFTPLCALLTAFTPKILLMWIPRSLSKGKTLLKTSKAMESVIVINRIQAKTWARGMAYQFLKTKTLLCETRWFHALCTIYMKITKVFVKWMNGCKEPKLSSYVVSFPIQLIIFPLIRYENLEEWFFSIRFKVEKKIRSWKRLTTAEYLYGKDLSCYFRKQLKKETPWFLLRIPNAGILYLLFILQHEMQKTQ